MGKLRRKRAARSRAHKRLSRTQRELADRRAYVRRLYERRAGAESAERKARLSREITAVKRQIAELEGVKGAVRDRIRRLTGAIGRLKRRRRRIVLTPGHPHWGGADDILRLEVEPIAARRGLRPNSAKRPETYGNPTSDHHTSQTLASARDFPTANNYALRDEIMRALGVGGPISDYGLYYIRRRRQAFRVQPIAATHGTGPHLHIGMRRG